MLSCPSLEHEARLDVFEFEHLPAGEYCAVSYVWRGVPVPGYSDVGTFTVRGAEDGDPISIDVLRDIGGPETIIRVTLRNALKK